MARAEHSVPIAMGSARSRALQTPSFRATEMWFQACGRLARHSHPLNGLAVMLEGSFDLGTRGGAVACPAGAVLIEPAGESHTNRMDRAGAHVLALQIDPADAALRTASGSVLDRPRHLRDAAVLTLAWRIAAELRSPDAASALAVEGLGLEMIARASRLQACRAEEREPPRWMRTVRDLVHDRFLERLEVQTIAREAGVHPVHLARVFRRHMGVSLGAYVRGLRLERAAVRLAAGDDPISDIAVECGFADQSHFTRIFRRRTGATPGRYRRAARDS
ncbi:MAG TPA: AraC family transcriptional regulator [Candidatus Polarisedimenticolia bacterium]|nr:AraC family transcriptional regulator [Candidatus Polarisedimenticolia bacterium]